MRTGIESAFKAAGVEFGKKNIDFINQFKYNASVFSAFKNHRQTGEIVSLLTDADGKLRSFSQFRKEANQVSKDYNQKWLQTEYNTAVRAARAAANYKKYLESADLYPNLEYMLSTAPDKSRRKIHEGWVGTVLPIEHPWWDTHMPPSDWNCQCSVAPTDKPETAVPAVEDPKNPVFRNNPGKTAQFIKLAEHPYVKGNCPYVGNCSRQSLSYPPSEAQHLLYPPSEGAGGGKVNLTLSNTDRPYREQCKICELAKTWYANQLRIEENRKTYEELLKDKNYTDVHFNPKTGGLKATHIHHNFDPEIGRFGLERGEYERRSQNVLYNYGQKVILESERAPEGVKTPDGSLNNIKFDIKGVEGTKKKTITRKFLSANKQNADIIVLYYHNESVFSVNRLRNGYADYLEEMRLNNIQNNIRNIYYIIGNKLYKFR